MVKMEDKFSKMTAIHHELFKPDGLQAQFAEVSSQSNEAYQRLKVLQQKEEPTLQEDKDHCKDILAIPNVLTQLV